MFKSDLNGTGHLNIRHVLHVVNFTILSSKNVQPDIDTHNSSMAISDQPVNTKWGLCYIGWLYYHLSSTWLQLPPISTCQRLVRRKLRHAIGIRVSFISESLYYAYF